MATPNESQQKTITKEKKEQWDIIKPLEYKKVDLKGATRGCREINYHQHY